MAEDLRGSSPLEDFLVRGGSFPVDLPPGIINPAAISSLIEQEGGEVGWVMVIKADGVAGWQPIASVPGPGGLPILAFPRELDDLLDVTLSGLNTCDFLVYTGAFWTNSPATKVCLPPEIAYEDEENTFVEAIRRPLKTITVDESPYAIQTKDWHINAFPELGDVVLTLPDAVTSYDSGNSVVLTVKNTSERRFYEVTIRPSVINQKIDGLSAVAIRTPYKSLTFVSDGNNWFIQ